MFVYILVHGREEWVLISFGYQHKPKGFGPCFQNISPFLMTMAINNCKFVRNIPGLDAVENRLPVWTVDLKMWRIGQVLFLQTWGQESCLRNRIRKSSLFCFCKCF